MIVQKGLNRSHRMRGARYLAGSGWKEYRERQNRVRHQNCQRDSGII